MIMQGGQRGIEDENMGYSEKQMKQIFARSKIDMSTLTLEKMANIFAKMKSKIIDLEYIVMKKMEKYNLIKEQNKNK